MSAESTAPLRVALLGCGVVGSAVVRASWTNACDSRMPERLSWK